jgi:hypothetical protein
MDPKLADCRGCAARVGGKAALGAERPDHAGQRVVGISGTGTTAALLKDADPMSLLREVRQAEVEQEGPDHDHGSRVVEAVKLALEGATRSGIAVTGPDGTPAGSLDEPPKTGTSLLLDHLAEQTPQAGDLEGKRIRATHATAGWRRATPSRN